MGNSDVIMSLTPHQEDALRATPMPTDELLETFKALDPQDTGMIDANEFMRALRIFGGQSHFQEEEEKALRSEMGLPPTGGDFDYKTFVQLRDCLANRKVK